MSWKFRINGNNISEPVDCKGILSPTSMITLAPSLCRHNENVLTLFASNASTLHGGDDVILIDHPEFHTSTETFQLLRDLPYVELEGGRMYDSAENIILRGVPKEVKDISPIYTWTQLSGPQQLNFVPGELQTFRYPSLRTGTYNVHISMLIPNSNDYAIAHSTQIIVKSKFKSAVELGNLLDLRLTWPFAIEGNMVNNPVECQKIMNDANYMFVDPSKCTHNQNVINIYVENTSTMKADSIFHIVHPDFSEDVNFTLPRNIPKLAIYGNGTYSENEMRPLIAVPSDIGGYVPRYLWAQESGPENLGINSSSVYQNFHPSVLSTGEYTFNNTMFIPPEELNYTFTAFATFIMQSKLLSAEQYGNRFTIYLTYMTWFSGSKRNIPINCPDLLDTGTLALLQPSRCEHDYDVLKIFASNLSTGKVVTLKEQSFYSETVTYTGGKEMPEITSLTQSLSDPWESGNEGNFLDTTNENCEGLKIYYIWEVVSGHPILSLADAHYSRVDFEPMELAAGDYIIKCTMEVIGGNGYQRSQTISLKVLVRIYQVSQVANLITILMSGPYYFDSVLIGNSTCNNILSPAFLAKVGSTPLCVHENNNLRLYMSNNSIAQDEEQFDLIHTHFFDTQITVMAIPTLQLTIPSAADGIYQVRTELCILQSTLTNSKLAIYQTTWTQFDNSSKIYFEEGLALIQKIAEQQLKANNYSVGVKIYYNSSNDFELNMKVNFTYASRPTPKIVGGNMGFNLNSKLELLTYMSQDTDISILGPDIKWEWESSSLSDFTEPLKLSSGGNFDPSLYENKDIVLPGKSLAAGKYYFKLKIRKWEYYRSELITHIEAFESGPTLRLLSESTQAKHSPQKDLCIQATSESFDGYPLETKWAIKPAVSEVDASPQRFCVLSQFLVPGQSYLIICQTTELINGVTSTEGESETEGTGERRLAEADTNTRVIYYPVIIAQYPIASGVTISPKEGYGLTQNFTITMGDWRDKEGTLLQFMLTAKVVGSNAGFVTVSPYTSMKTFKTFLPAGNITYNYLVVVRIVGKNSYGVTASVDRLVKVMEPQNITKPNEFLDEQLFSDFENRPISDKLFRMSSATFFSKIESVEANSTDNETKVVDACGGCGTNGECLSDIKECECTSGYEGDHCEFSPDQLDELSLVNQNILESIYIYIYNI